MAAVIKHSRMNNWTPERVGDLTGKTLFISGANSGIGLEATKILCAKGAHVIVAARSEKKATGAVDTVLQITPDAQISWVLLDLTDPDSIQAAADKVSAEHDKLDVLINNAGIMQTPERRTAEGFELQLGTNHIGHFRLSRALFPKLVQSKGRVVSVSSIAHKQGRMNWDDLMYTKGYDPTWVYCQSKLANLLFAFELNKRCAAAGNGVTSYACHPGYSATNLQTAGVGMDGGSGFFKTLYAITNKVVAQSPELGSWPTVLCAVDPDAKPGGYYGPTGLMDYRGPVGEANIAPQALVQDDWKRLWEETEKLVGEWTI